MYGPIESRFDRVRNIHPGDITDGHDSLAKEHALYMSMHLGTDVTVKGRLLPAFGILRNASEKSSQGNPVPTDEVKQALIDGGHLGREWFKHDTHMAVLGKAYMLDREAIDRALDFERVKQQGQ